MNPRQRRALELFSDSSVITSRHVETPFGISQRAARNVLSAWVRDGFVVVTDPARKSRKYSLAAEFAELLPGGTGI